MQLPWFSDTYAISGGWILISQDENFNDKAVIMIEILTGVQTMFGTIQKWSHGPSRRGGSTYIVTLCDAIGGRGKEFKRMWYHIF